MPEIPDWQRYGYASYESYISSKAGASPPDCDGSRSCAALVHVHGCYSEWPMPYPPPYSPPDDEDDPAPRGDAE